MRGEGIVPVMEVGNNNNGGFGGFGNNGDWAWIIILFLIFGFNGNRSGFGGGYGGGSGVADNYVLATDFATIERKLDSISNGICDSTFALNNTIVNGNFGLQNSLTQGFSGLNTALLQGNYALSSQFANCCCDLKTAISDCCCKTQSGLQDISYNIAIGNNAITNAMCNNTRDIIENQNNNYRALRDELVAFRIQDKDQQIQTQQNEINALRLKASQEAQSNYIINQLKPCPDPAYIVPNPNCCYNYQVTQCNPCGCGQF